MGHGRFLPTGCTGAYGQWNTMVVRFPNKYIKHTQEGQRLELECQFKNTHERIFWIRMDKNGNIHFILSRIRDYWGNLHGNKKSSPNFEGIWTGNSHRLVVKNFRAQDQGTYYCVSNINQVLHFSSGQPAFFPVTTTVAHTTPTATTQSSQVTEKNSTQQSPTPTGCTGAYGQWNTVAVRFPDKNIKYPQEGQQLELQCKTYRSHGGIFWIRQDKYGNIHFILSRIRDFWGNIYANKKSSPNFEGIWRGNSHRLVVKNFRAQDQGTYYCINYINQVLHFSSGQPVFFPVTTTAAPTTPDATTQSSQVTKRDVTTRSLDPETSKEKTLNTYCKIVMWVNLSCACLLLLTAVAITISLCKALGPVNKQDGRRHDPHLPTGCSSAQEPRNTMEARFLNRNMKYPQEGQRLELECSTYKTKWGSSWIRQDKDGNLHFIVTSNSQQNNIFHGNMRITSRYEVSWRGKSYQLVVKNFRAKDQGTYFCFTNINQVLHFSSGQPAFFPVTTTVAHTTPTATTQSSQVTENSNTKQSPAPTGCTASQGKRDAVVVTFQNGNVKHPQEGQRLELDCWTDKTSWTVTWIRLDKKGKLHFILSSKSWESPTHNKDYGTSPRFEAMWRRNTSRLVVKSFSAQDEGIYFCITYIKKVQYISPGQPAFFPGQQQLHPPRLHSS
ncbi:hypothetical protein ASZ78_016887 [Callipepla squamata]|uniref:T-cell surface glycoprotein CD8 alpha chain n=1 Tax=Callipepla squamata TaxID=9009 RepID=A0A226MVH6_CALSU|nr:hypothetical protein ASZ78_016887 [Callipepla squamata]